MVFKQYRYDTKYDHEDYEYMRMDAFVTEIFTSSDLYVDMYGFCGLSALTEAMPDGCVQDLALPLQSERGEGTPLTFNDENDVDPKNNLTVTQKLTFSLEMAESIAMMHNYRGGVIVHDDGKSKVNLLYALWTYIRLTCLSLSSQFTWNSFF
jgi:hypothetical protein